MLVPFDQMPENSRLWIYQAERKLSAEEIKLIANDTDEFLTGWAAHGNGLKASFKIERDQFLIITVDEGFSQASGCSIDASVNLVRNLESQLGISFMNNNKVAFLINDEIELIPFNSIKDQASNNIISASTKVFDNTVKNLGEFKSNWLTDSGLTWLNRYFN